MKLQIRVSDGISYLHMVSDIARLVVVCERSFERDAHSVDGANADELVVAN